MTTTTHQGPTRPRSANGYATRVAERDRLARQLFVLASAPGHEQQREEILGRVVEMHLDLAHALASRFRSRGVPLEDLRQVAALALTAVVRRYDVALGHEFASYAVPSIRGELRKHFRDHGWMVRPPRRIQELQARIGSVEPGLTQELGRAPLPCELAARLGEHLDAVLEALSSDGCFVPASLERPVSSDRADTLGDLVTAQDTDHVAAEARLVLHPLLRELPERDREILRMRFFEQLTQSEIASRVGRSKMAVSRDLTRVLAHLRSAVGDVTVG